jgi:hypothetical protein
MSIQTVIGFAVTAAIFYFVTSYRQRDPEGFLSAYRIGLIVALICVLVMMIPYVRAYSNLVTRTTKESRRITAPPPPPHKLTATDLQAGYLKARMVSPQSALRCTTAVRDWDYVCSYMPTPLQSKTRVAFGVMVDETTVLQTSPAVPDGTMLPAPPRRR